MSSEGKKKHFYTYQKHALCFDNYWCFQDTKQEKQLGTVFFFFPYAFNFYISHSNLRPKFSKLNIQTGIPNIELNP